MQPISLAQAFQPTRAKAGPSPEGEGETSPFADLLQSLAAAPPAQEEPATLPGNPFLAEPKTGTILPAGKPSGKTLPLPVLDAETEAAQPEEPVSATPGPESEPSTEPPPAKKMGDNAPADPVLIAAPAADLPQPLQLPPAAPQAAPSSAPRSERSTPALPRRGDSNAAQPAGQRALASESVAPFAVAQPVSAVSQQAKAGAAPVVTLRMAARDTGAARRPGTAAATEDAPTSPAQNTAALLASATPKPSRPASAAPEALQPTATGITHAADLAQLSPSAAATPATESLRDFAELIDRLAAAREALSPASESLSIDHAEFGELSLSFQQRNNGGLSVELAAGDAETHRALAAALASERGQGEQGRDEQGNGTSADRQQQQQSALNGSGRNGTGEGSSSQRDDRPRTTPQRPSETPTASHPDEQGRAGIFA